MRKFDYILFFIITFVTLIIPLGRVELKYVALGLVIAIINSAIFGTITNALIKKKHNG